MSRHWVALTILILALGTLGSAWAGVRVSELLGLVMAGALLWRVRRRAGRPAYSRLATRSINCRPVDGVSRRC